MMPSDDKRVRNCMDWHFTHVASQGAFAVIPEVSYSDISCIIKIKRRGCRINEK